MRRTSRIAVITAAVAVAGLVPAANAADIKLRIASGHPPGVVYAGLMKDYFQPEFKKRVEEEFPTRRVTVGRCAHLTEPTAEHIALGRGPCQLRATCERGCRYGAYFS